MVIADLLKPNEIKRSTGHSSIVHRSHTFIEVVNKSRGENQLLKMHQKIQIGDKIKWLSLNFINPRSGLMGVWVCVCGAWASVRVARSRHALRD